MHPLHHPPVPAGPDPVNRAVQVVASAQERRVMAPRTLACTRQARLSGHTSGGEQS